jgi:REP element-mobilizing transposase RayT
MSRPHSKDLRKGRVSIPGQPYLVTTNVEGRRPVFLDLFAARAVIGALRYQQEAGRADTLAFVVMPDHLHWLLVLGKRLSLSKVLATVKGFSAASINAEQRTSERLWQPGFHDHGVRAEEDLRALARYVIANPVRAGLV